MVVRIDAATQSNQRINGIGPYLREMSPEFFGVHCMSCRYICVNEL